MKTAIICTALLGFLVFALGLAISMTRRSTATGIGYKDDPTDPLYKLVRAHGNACEYAPMMALLILMLGAREPGALLQGTFIVATASRYLHAAGMVLSPTLKRPQPLRFAGALGTYITGLILVVAMIFSAA